MWSRKEFASWNRDEPDRVQAGAAWALSRFMETRWRHGVLIVVRSLDSTSDPMSLSWRPSEKFAALWCFDREWSDLYSSLIVMEANTPDSWSHDRTFIRDGLRIGTILVELCGSELNVSNWLKDPAKLPEELNLLDSADFNIAYLVASTPSVTTKTCIVAPANLDDAMAQMSQAIGPTPSR